MLWEFRALLLSVLSRWIMDASHHVMEDSVRQKAVENYCEETMNSLENFAQHAEEQQYDKNKDLAQTLMLDLSAY